MDRFLASDHGLIRFRFALRAVLSVAFAVLVLALVGIPVSTMLLGAICAMVCSTSMRTGSSAERGVQIALYAPVMCASVTVATLLAPYHLVADAAFLAVMFGAVYIRRFDPIGPGLGMGGFMAYFFALFVHLSSANLPLMYLSALVGLASCATMSLLVLRDAPASTLRRTMVSIRAQVARLVEELATLLDGTWRPSAAQELPRAVARQAVRMHETTLQIEDYADLLGLDPQWQRQLVDAELSADRLARTTIRALAADLDAQTRAELAMDLRGLHRFVDRDPGAALSLDTEELMDRIARYDIRGDAGLAPSTPAHHVLLVHRAIRELLLAVVQIRQTTERMMATEGGSRRTDLSDREPTLEDVDQDLLFDDEPGAEPAAEPGTEPFARSGVDPADASDAGPGAERSAGLSAEPAVGPGAERSAGRDTEPCAGPGAEPAAGPGTEPAVGPGTGRLDAARNGSMVAGAASHDHGVGVSLPRQRHATDAAAPEAGNRPSAWPDATAPATHDVPTPRDTLDAPGCVADPQAAPPPARPAAEAAGGATTPAGDAVSPKGQRRHRVLEYHTRAAIQAVIGGAFAILGGTLMSGQRWYWAVIAGFIVFAGTNSRGDLLVKGWRRVLGTMLGIIAGTVLATLLAGHPSVDLVLVLLCIFLAFYSLRVSYATMTFFITVMLGMLYDILGEFTPHLLLLRLEETAIGVAGSVVAAMLVLPARTRTTVLTELHDYFVALHGELVDAKRLLVEADQVSVIAATREVDRAAGDVRTAIAPMLYRLTPSRVRRGHATRLLTLTEESALAARNLARAAEPGALAQVPEAVEALHRLIGNTEVLAATTRDPRHSVKSGKLVSGPALASAVDVRALLDAHRRGEPDRLEVLHLHRTINSLDRLDKLLLGMAAPLARTISITKLEQSEPHTVDVR